MKMKRYKLLLIALLIVGCEKDSPTAGGGESESLVGTWDLIEFTEKRDNNDITLTTDCSIMVGFGCPQTYILNADSTFSLNGFFNRSGTWSTADNYITFSQDHQAVISTYYSISSGILTFTRLYGPIHEVMANYNTTYVETFHKQQLTP